MQMNDEGGLRHILGESPFFVALSLMEKQELMRELLRTYPELSGYSGNEYDDVGYESGWVPRGRANDVF